MNIKQDVPKINQRALVALNNVNTLRIDANITPIYPVRYAYANFFEVELADAKAPPAISTLLNNLKLKDTDGYVLRILREGWLYIREEDDSEKGHLHIFKYEQIKTNHSVTEKFTKYLFKNKINAQGGLVKETSRSNYPFAFVRNGIREVSIVYSEHEFHPDVIDKLNGSENERKECMQRVNLDSGSDDYAIEANPENLGKLVEDYRELKDRVLALKDDDINSELKEFALDVLTAEISYELEPESIAAELQKKIDYGENARIVALFDPVGRQKEIAQAHSKLVIWEKEYAATTIYPYTIGSIVKSFRETNDEDIKEIVEDAINWDAHEEHWGGMNQAFEEFQNRQKAFVDLYTSFMMDDTHTLKIGTLDTYFRKFFCHDVQTSDGANLELQKLCNVSADIFAGILASRPSSESIDEIINDAAEKAEEHLDSMSNAYAAIFEGLIKIITTPQEAVNWKELSKKAADRLMDYLGPKWGEMRALARYKKDQAGQESVRFSAKALTHVAEKLIPKILDVYGLRVDDNNRVTLTLDELAEVLAKQFGKSQVKFGYDAIDMAQFKQKTGQGLIDWAERSKRVTIPYMLSKISVPVVMGATNIYNHAFFEKAGNVIGIGMEVNFTGVSIYFNVSNMYDFIYQTEMAETDPLTKKNQLIEVMRFSSTLLALTVDGLQVGKGLKAASESSVIAKYLHPNLASKSNLAGKILSKTVSNKFMVLLNFVGVTVSIWDTVDAYQKGNRGETAGYGIITIGSAMLLAQACYGAAVGAGLLAGGTSWTVLGGLAFGLASLAALGTGVALVVIFGKPRFQLLLEGCFWGVGNEHIFAIGDDKKLSVIDRVDATLDLKKVEIKKSFEKELQEFNNIRYQPQLEIETDRDFSEISLKGLPTRYTYTFKLPGFQQGVSNLHVEVHRGLKQNEGRVVSSMDYTLTTQLKSAMKEVDIEYENGMATFSIYMEMPEQVTLYWHYRPTPDIKAPHRIISEDGDIQRPLLGMIDEESV